MHPDEPSIEELKKLFNEMIKTPTTADDTNIKKLAALEKQIERREAEGKLQKKVEATSEKLVEKVEAKSEAK